MKPWIKYCSYTYLYKNGSTLIHFFKFDKIKYLIHKPLMNVTEDIFQKARFNNTMAILEKLVWKPSLDNA